MLDTVATDACLIDRIAVAAVWAAAVFAKGFTIDFVRYLIAAALIFGLLGRLFARRLAGRRIQRRRPRPRQMRRELGWSAASCAVFGAIGIAAMAAVAAGWSRLYFDFGAHGWAYWVLSLAVMILLHDAYFYWTHRAMHLPALYRLFHRVHHRSVTPTPWAAYSFAPAEAVVHGLFVPAMIMVLPLHPFAVFVFVAHQVLRNALGHAGVELFPHGASHSRSLGWLTMTTHHDLHHARVVGNYGLYFTWWDRLMGTEIADYRAVFDAVTDPLRAVDAGARDPA